MFGKNDKNMDDNPRTLISIDRTIGDSNPNDRKKKSIKEMVMIVKRIQNAINTLQILSL